MGILRWIYRKILAIKVSFLDTVISEREEIVDDPVFWNNASSGTIEKVLTEIEELRKERNRLARKAGLSPSYC